MTNTTTTKRMEMRATTTMLKMIPMKILLLLLLLLLQLMMMMMMMIMLLLLLLLLLLWWWWWWWWWWRQWRWRWRWRNDDDDHDAKAEINPMHPDFLSCRPFAPVTTPLTAQGIPPGGHWPNTLVRGPVRNPEAARRALWRCGWTVHHMKCISATMTLGECSDTFRASNEFLISNLKANFSD